jgi:hypothetical protein
MTLGIECRYAECRVAECRDYLNFILVVTKCHYAECRGALRMLEKYSSLFFWRKTFCKIDTSLTDGILQQMQPCQKKI